MTDPEKPRLKCSACRAAIDCCEFCDETDCPKAICFTCVIVAFGQATPHPHTHGG